MTEAEFSEIVTGLARGEVLRLIDEEADPTVRAMLARDMPRIVSAFVARSLKASAPAFRADAERERLHQAARDGAVH